MYSAYKFNKQGDNIQPWRTPCLIWNQSVVPCPVLTVASWPAYRFLKRQGRWSAIPISFRIFQFIVIHTVKGFGIVIKAEVETGPCLLCIESQVSIQVWENTLWAPRPGQIPLLKMSLGTFLVIQWLRLCTPNAGGLGSISGQGTRSHVLQWRLKIPCVANKTECR